MTRVPKLPPELLTMVIIQLGSPRRNALHPLLTVSHAMYDMVVPLIYETLVIAYFDGGDPSITYEACTHVPPTHLHHLYESLAQNPALGEYASTFIADPVSLTTDINNIISYLPYLQRISLSSTGPDDAFLESIPESGTLTHLTIPFGMPMTMKNLLCSCSTSLRFLSLSGLIRDLADFLPSNANMNCLDTFEVIRTRNLDAIFGVAPIQHLSVVDLKVDSIMRPEAVLSNLLTLQVHRIYSRQGLSLFSPYLKNLRLLYLSFTMDENNTEIQTQDLLNVASKSLCYIHICRLASTTVDPSQVNMDLGELYKRYPSLLAVDVRYRDAASIFESYLPTFRYFSHAELPVRMDIRRQARFEQWWEPFIDGLGITL